MKGVVRKIIHLGALGIITGLSFPLYASGYRLEFQTPSVLADGGDAAVVEDAGTNWYNSAGLVYLPQQLALSAIDVYVQTTFRGTATTPPGPLGFNGAGKATSYPNPILPGIHYALPFKEQFAFGLSIVPAWGLLEDYGQNSIVRYNLTRIYTKSLDIAPSFAWKINDQWSIGLGPDFHYFSIEESAHVFTEPFGTPGDSLSRISANNWGYGAHAGVLYRASDATRVGLNYRTRISMDLRGYSDFAMNHGPSYESNKFQVTLPLPPTTSLSVYHDINPCWAIMGTLSYDQWTVIRDLHGFNYIGPGGVLASPTGQNGYKNTFDLSAGVHYKASEQWLLRGSLKYQQTPTTDQFRDVYFPDSEKLGINLGARYQMSKKVAVDLIYAHVFTRTATINGTNPASLAHVSGNSRTSVDLAGAQLVWNI